MKMRDAKMPPAATAYCYEYGVKHHVSHLMPEIKSGEDTWITCAVPI
jgi:hypothetical protein